MLVARAYKTIFERETMNNQLSFTDFDILSDIFDDHKRFPRPIKFFKKHARTESRRTSTLMMCLSIITDQDIPKELVAIPDREHCGHLSDTEYQTYVETANGVNVDIKRFMEWERLAKVTAEFDEEKAVNVVFDNDDEKLLCLLKYG